MGLLRALWGLLTARWLWTLIGLVLLSVLICTFGPGISVYGAAPLASDLTRAGLVAALFLTWAAWQIARALRARRANRLFVSEIALVPDRPLSPGADNVAAVGAKFQEILGELKRRKLAGKRFLRDMPWYVIIGPPATGKTTALRQSGLSFPLDLGDDLAGIGGTRNCDWFFTEDAVLIDTAGRYVQQESAPEIDAAEWLGFLDLLKKHRGRRALNGVIVALSIETLSEGDAAIRAHGRQIRKRLLELRERLEIRLPVYLILTKADLIEGFEPFFGGLSTADREQVWGATFAPGARIDGAEVGRELALLAGQLEGRLVARLEAEEALGTRAAIFRFPAQVTSLAEPIRLLVDTVFGESRYEESAWLRGVYFTSATQEGTPIDRLTAALASSFGLPALPRPAPPRFERRSFFLKRLLGEVIFREAGLGRLDPAAEERRRWIWRGAAVACAGIVVLAGLLFTLSYLANRGAIAAQADQLEQLQATLAPVAARQVPLDPLDLGLALDAVTEVANARTPAPGGMLAWIGPSAGPELARADRDAYDRALRNILEPRMVALLEATMWRQIRDPDFLLGALKTYRMMTGGAAMDTAFAVDWWQTRLPKAAPIPPLPTQAAAEHQLAAFELMARDADPIPPDDALVTAALASICSIPLPVRAYNALLSDPAVTALPDWIPAGFAGPNASKVLIRRSGKTLRVGIDGAFTYDGFHKAILDRLPEIATQQAMDRSVFAGGCTESAETTVSALSQDILQLYYQDYIAQWDGFLHDIALAPLTNLQVAGQNLKDLSSADSALKRLLLAVVAETDLARPTDSATAAAAPPSFFTKVLTKLGSLGKLASKSAKLIPAAGNAADIDLSGQPVSAHFKPLRAVVTEVDGAPPLLDGTVAALTQLSSVIQTVSVSPNPEDAIKKQGGLAELTGAVTSQAALLPEPLNGWFTGLAGDTSAITQKAVATDLNAIWRADGLPFCQAALAGRYPFDPSSTIDVNPTDFARVFGPGGLIDSFTNDHLLPYVDTSHRPWRWRADLGLDPQSLAAFEQARAIRDSLFPGGAGPSMNFSLEPKDLSQDATRVTLNLDGQLLSYFNNATRPMPMSWPGKDGTGVILLSFQPIDGSPEVMISETGSWAWLRMLKSGRLSATDQPDLFKLRLSAKGHYADFDLRSASVDNPFDLTMFAKFTCPTQI